MRQPSKLRYVECDLPSEVEKAIIAFEDSFDDSLKPFYDRLADFVANDLPLIQTELDAQVALREELVKGAPVQSLGSLEAIDSTTNLTSPKRDNDAPETVRIDERKLGAAGICLLNGKMFKIITGGSRLLALRHLWECAGGDYDYFVRLGTFVYTSPKDSCTLFEYNKATPEKFPYVNRGFTYLEKVELKKNSQFKHRMIWNRSISASYALKAKMTTLGYTSEQINNIFAGVNPNLNFDYLGTIADINVLIRSVTRLVFLPPNDPIRQPVWENEANYIELAIKKFLAYRLNKYTTSAIFTPDYWTTFLTELRPADIKELLEYRPEILDIELPQDQDSLTALVEKATAIGAETTIINTYMNNLPVGSTEEDKLTSTMYDLGLAIWKELITIKAMPSLRKELQQLFQKRAARLEALLLELIGKTGPLNANSPFLNPSILINPADLSSLFPSTNLPPVGPFVDLLKKREDSALIDAALGANSSASSYETSETKETQQENLTLEQGSTTNNTPAGVTQGFPSEETFAMLLARRLKWKENFLDCSGEQILGKATTPVVQAMAPAKNAAGKDLSFEINKSEPTNAQWAQHRDNLSYISKRLGTQLTGSSVTDIRDSTNAFVKTAQDNGSISEFDTNRISLQAKMNTSNDAKIAATNAVLILKMIPETTTESEQTALGTAVNTEAQLFSELQGTYTSAGIYAAKNRNYVESQGGKVPPPNGLTQSEFKSGMEHALGKPLPFIGKGDSAILPTKGSYNVELQFCENKALKKLSNYGRQLQVNRKLFEDWIIKFVNICKHQIIMFQDKIDTFIIMLQQAMDSILAKLERLLTLDLNFSGKIGFENSLFKCSWGLDFGLKINLLDLLLIQLDRFLGTIMGPVLKGLGIFADFINQIMCVPIRWLESILTDAAKYMQKELLGKIGCTVKDFKLPTAIFELLNLISGTFSLRSLVLRKGSADWLKMMGRIKLGMDEFTGLSQFASACASPTLATALSALQNTAATFASDIPIKASAVHQGVDSGTMISNNIA
jgi:hypothetical protein